MSLQSIHDAVRSGRISPADGAFLIDLRRRLAYARPPWWFRLGAAIGRWM